MGKIARIAGVSPAAVSYALRNKPGLARATREKILRIAHDLGYSPDARMVNWMARVRDAKSKDLLPIAWLNTSSQKEAWRIYRFHTPYIEGAEARALELGYKLEEIWATEPGMTMRRLSKILYQRGIEGVVVTQPARHFRLDWSHLASVTLGGALVAPRLHRVTADITYNLQLALKSVKRLGYRRIGICLSQVIDTASQYNIRALARDLYFDAPEAERIPPLFLSQLALARRTDLVEDTKEEILTWFNRYRPEVIVAHDGRMKKWAEQAGLAVPRDLGLVHLAVDDDVLDWAGIHSRRRETGATAIDELVALMRNREFGVPKTPRNILIRGSWNAGSTLSPARPGASRAAAARS